MKSVRYIAASSAMILSLLFLSCEKELDFKYHEIEPLTVIEANLTETGMRARITLTTPMGEPMDSTGLTDAVMRLTDVSEGTVWTLRPDADGYYTNPAAGISGHEYVLEVERQGRRYEATATMYPSVSAPELEFNWIKMPYDEVAVLKCSFPALPGAEDACYWVKVYRNGEMYKWVDLDYRSNSDGQYSFLLMTTRRDTEEEDEEDVLYDGDVITCTVSQVSRGMYEYLEAIQTDSNGPRMFSGDFCLGYFLAASPVSSSIVFHPDAIPAYPGK